MLVETGVSVRIPTTGLANSARRFRPISAAVSTGVASWEGGLDKDSTLNRLALLGVWQLISEGVPTGYEWSCISKD